MPKHIRNLLLLLGGFLLVAYLAKIYLTDPSYYKYGYYRADAVPEIASGEPLYKGAGYWLECHPERQADWPTGNHKTVACQVCHGATVQCAEDGAMPKPADTIRLCTTCHLEMPARPARQPQIVLGDHPFPGEETPRCTTCHDPHSPENWVAGAIDTSADPQETVTEETPVKAPAAVSKCAKCHGKQGQGRGKNPPIAGLEPSVFVERMDMYIYGDRDSKIMERLARALNEQEIEELAEYYASLRAASDE